MPDEIAFIVVLIAVVVVFAATVVVPIALFGGIGAFMWWGASLVARVEALEKRIASLQAAEPVPVRAGLPPEPADEEVTEETTAPAVSEAERVAEAPEAPPKKLRPTPAPKPTPTPEPAGPSKPTKPPFELPSPERVAVWVAAGLGGLLLVLAALFGLALASQYGWLGPAARVAGGLAGGTGLWLVGVAVRRRIPVVGAALAGVAIGVLYGSLFAAHGLYELVSSSVAFVAMIAVTVVATLTAARDNDRFTAHIALVGGLLTPVLVSTGENNPVALFAYLALLLLGVLLAARHRGWWDVTLMAALGAAALHIGWSARWYAADQAPAGLVGALLVTVPFALVATAKPLPVRVVGFACAVVMPLLAAPWLIPVSPTFTDPLSYLVVVQPLDNAGWWVAGALAALMAPAWLAARGHEHPAGSGLASLAASLLVAFAGVAWAIQDMPPVVPLALFALGPLVVGTLALARSKAAAGLLPMPVVAGVGLAVLAGAREHESAAVVGLGLTALVVFGYLASLSRSGVVVASTVTGAAVGAVVAAMAYEAPDRAWVTGPSLLALGVLGSLPLARKWPGDPRGPWIASALVWPAMFPALHLLWREGFGPEVIGALPVLLGAGALIGALTLLRRERVDRGNLALAVFIGVALLGAVGAVAVQLQEGWLTVVWALEAAALGLLARALPHPLVRWAAVGLGVTVAIRLLVNPWALGYGDASGWPVLNWTLYTWGIPFLALLILANGLPRRGDLLDWSIPFVRVLALLVGFALVEVQVATAFQDAGPVELGGNSLWQGMARSTAWAAYGLGVLVAGLATDRREVRFLGFSFILLATAKVFAVDLWSLSGFVRVGSVAALGVSLLVAAFLFERLVLRSRAKEATP